MSIHQDHPHLQLPHHTCQDDPLLPHLQHHHHVVLSDDLWLPLLHLGQGFTNILVLALTWLHLLHQEDPPWWWLIFDTLATARWHSCPMKLSKWYSTWDFISVSVFNVWAFVYDYTMLERSKTSWHTFTKSSFHSFCNLEALTKIWNIFYSRVWNKCWLLLYMKA